MRERKKYAKAIASVLLVAAMVLQMIPSSVFVTEAAGASTAIGTVVNAENGIYYEYLDISAYRTEKDTEGNYTSCPQKDGFVFAGWYQEANETKAFGKETTTGTAWAKFVPEDTLSLKVQTTKRMAENPEQVKFRLVTSVDSLSYSRVGFSVTINGVTKELGLQKVYQEIKVTGTDNGTDIVNPKKEFCEASTYFATVKISNIVNTKFDNMEINATPWWITKDGTKVSGTGRSRMLVSDERINDADGKDFTVSGGTYTYKKETGSAASYQYFKGGSDTIYLKGTYTTAGVDNRFGISIRNGGETRQVFYDGYGVKVVAGEDMNASGYADGTAADTYNYITTTDDNGVWVWVQAYEQVSSDVTKDTAVKENIQSAVYDMVSAAAPGTHDVIWAIEKNVLYGSVDGTIFLRMPMEKLCAAWKDGRCYQLGVAGHNTTATDKNMVFALQELKFGKDAYKTANTNGLTAEKENLQRRNMIYEPIDGAYMPGSDVKDGDFIYARTAPKEAGTPVTVETVVENWGNSDNETGVGITIVVGDDNWNSVQFEIFNTGLVRLQGEYHYQGSTHFTTGPKAIQDKLSKKVTVAADAPERARIKAAVYDGKFMVLIDNVTAYERSMTELFKDSEGTSTYSADKTVSLGIVAHDTKQGYTPRFKEVKTYEGQDAIDAKMETWTFYPDDDKTDTINKKADVEAGTFSDGGSRDLQTAFLASSENSSKVWQVTGTMSHSGSGDAHQGLLIKGAGKWLYLLGGHNGIEKWLDGQWCDGTSTTHNTKHDHALCNNKTYNNGDNPYAFVKNSETNNYFYSTSGDGSVEFQAVLVDDTVFVWLNDLFSWMVPLTEAEFDSFPAGTSYGVKLFAGEGARNQSFEKIQVRTGSEVDATLVKNLKAGKLFDWHTAYKQGQKTLATDGVIAERGTTETASDVYAKGTSDNIYVSATYTKEEAKQGAYGVTLKDANGNHAARFWLNGQGYVQMTGNISEWGSHAMKNALSTNGTTPTLWAQNGSSAIKKVMDTAVAGTVNRIEWAVADNTLYCKVDGQISCIIPLSDVYSDWTDGTAYHIALAAWNTMNKGKTSISDLNVLFGEDAKAKLTDKAAVATGLTGFNKDMVYDALDGAYIPLYKDANAALYGEAGTTVSVETDMQLLDMATTEGAAGISVRIPATGKTAEFLIPVYKGENVSLRTFKNLYWNGVTDIDLPQGIVPFDETGYCHMSAMVAEGKLAIKFNGKAAYELELSKYLEGYTNGTAVQIGIATNNSDEGITFFRNVKSLVGDAVLASAGNWISKENNMDVVEENGALSLTKASTGEAGATFFGKSDKWEVTGTMSQQNLSTLLAQGFEITGKNASGKDTTVRLYGKDSGVTVVCNGATPVTYTPENDPSGILVNAESNLEFYKKFFSSSERTSADIEFRMRLAGDKLLVWFNGIQSWVIPLTNGAFGGFKAGSADYRISLFAGEGDAAAAFYQVERLYGNQVKDLMSIDTSLSEAYTADKSTGTVKRTGDQNTTAYFTGKSNVWEITGNMMADPTKTDGFIPHGFIVRDNSSGSYVRLYGGDGSIINGNTWEYFDGGSKYMVDWESNNKYFAKANVRTASQVQFRLVLVEDTLFLWLDDVLTWRIPLTDLSFGGFEKGSVYQVGLAVNGGTTGHTADDGTIIYRGLDVKMGGEANTAGATKLVTAYNYKMTVNALEGKVQAARTRDEVRHVYLKADDKSDYSTKWDATGTMRHGDDYQYDLMGFTVRDRSKKMGFSMWNNTLYVDFNGGAYSSPGWTQYTPDNAGACVFANSDASAFFQQGGTKTLPFRVVIVEDVLNVYFNDILTWKLPLTDPRFGGFTAGTAYQIGFCAFGGQGTEYYEDLNVKSGNAVLTLNDFRMRDVFILADDYNGEKTYYMYATRQSYTADVFTSPDLLVWEKQGQCFEAPQDFWGVSGQLWAPEVFKYTNPDSGETAYYMFVTTAKKDLVPTSTGGKVIPMGTEILKADSPLGPFRQWSKTSGGEYGPVTPLPDRCLDGTLYIEDGKPYMVYSHEYPVSWDYGDLNGTMYYIPLSKDLSRAVGAPVYMFNAKAAANLPDLNCYVTDGPFMYSSNGNLFCIWSTFADDSPSLEARYLELQLKSSNGKLVGGKWTYDPVAPRLYGLDEGKYDGGHGMIFTDFEGKERLVLHAPNMYHNSWTKDLNERAQILYIEYDSSIGYLRSHY